ncbi:M35 family metallopeptidase [Larkinella soli]|uniref:M35 family metallopeptidase n=1 Tax=Larkinella soli TaxID=1770527 RepID=UPI000FFB1E49|nr:M35 family metallopeptidase [Larkinella soli]
MTVHLEALLFGNAKYQSSEPVRLTFVLANPGDTDLYVLTWNTPFDYTQEEGLWSDCFQVTEGGKAVPYDGPLPKRGRPRVEDFLFLPAGRAGGLVINLDKTYPVTNPGMYRVSARLRAIPVFMAGSREELAELLEAGKPGMLSELISTLVEFRVDALPLQNRLFTIGEQVRQAEAAAAPFEEAVEIRFLGGSAGERDIVGDAHQTGFVLVQNAISRIDRDDLFREWFGAPSPGRLQAVRDNFGFIKAGMEQTSFIYDLTRSRCPASTIAHTFPGSSTIWICNPFFQLPRTGLDSQAGTIVHEHSHTSAGTSDVEGADDPDGARTLARTKPDQAVQSANNYEYYAGEAGAQA